MLYGKISASMMHNPIRRSSDSLEDTMAKKAKKKAKKS
jgi:hypothetical protein